MKTPYGLQVIDSCAECNRHKENFFCNLSPEVLQSFSAAGHQSSYPGGACLFSEGQRPRGAYVLCAGQVKLSTTSRDGKVLILKLAGPGEVLGLSAVISETCYEVTAETAGPCMVTYIEASTLIRLVSRYSELGFRTAQALSSQFQAAYRDIHDLVLARSSAGKLAKLLLSWGGERSDGKGEVRLSASLTHEEMGQMIGASRETVTRVISHLKRKELIRVEGSRVVIRNRTALEALAI